MLALVMPSPNAPLSGENEEINGTVGPGGGAVVMLFVIVTLFDWFMKICRVARRYNVLRVVSINGIAGDDGVVCQE